MTVKYVCLYLLLVLVFVIFLACHFFRRSHKSKFQWWNGGLVRFCRGLHVYSDGWNTRVSLEQKPILHYIRNLKCTNLRFISDILKHDVETVFEIIWTIVRKLKQDDKACTKKKIHYFSNGCWGQYKNWKNIINLCYHHQDFIINCDWSFYAALEGQPKDLLLEQVCKDLTVWSANFR